MGWKNIKTHYKIQHIVHINENGDICIGSSFCPEIIVIGGDGTLKKRYGGIWDSDEDLLRYQREMDADPKKLRELAQPPDSFDKAVVVYTYNGGDIVQHLCEEPGWPNVTYEGHTQYENTFSTDKSKVVRWAKDSNKSQTAFIKERIQ